MWIGNQVERFHNQISTLYNKVESKTLTPQFSMGDLESGVEICLQIDVGEVL